MPEAAARGPVALDKYFTEAGEFCEDVYVKDLKTHIKRFEEGRYGEIKYDHKAD